MLTLPLMIPLPRVRRAGALFEWGFELSFMPSAPLGVDSLPPMLTVFVRGAIDVVWSLYKVDRRCVDVQLSSVSILLLPEVSQVIVRAKSSGLDARSYELL